MRRFWQSMQRYGPCRAYINGMNGRSSAVLVPPPSASGSPSKRIAGPGSWKYGVKRRSWPVFWTAVAISAAFHLTVFFGFQHQKPKPKHVVVDDAIALNFVMVDVKELEEPDRPLGDEQTPTEEGLSVPTLADVPTQIDLSQAFVQQIDYSTLVPKQDLSAARTLAVPVHYSRGSRLGEGMEKIFNLSDLDRPPEPLVKVAPGVPPPLKQAGTHVVVMVLFVVDANGVVRNPEIYKSDDPRFSDPALIAMGKWKFRPGIKNGRRVNVRMMQPMIFDVKDSD